MNQPVIFENITSGFADFAHLIFNDFLGRSQLLVPGDDAAAAGSRFSPF